MFAAKSIIVAFVAFAATAYAAPADGAKKPELTVEQAAQQCGNNEKLTCCNSKDDKGNSDGLLSGVLSGLGGANGNCDNPSTIPLINVLVPISSTCTSNVACCSGGDDEQLPINLQCNNIVV